jgi:hypothetical protein
MALTEVEIVEVARSSVAALERQGRGREETGRGRRKGGQKNGAEKKWLLYTRLTILFQAH